MVQYKQLFSILHKDGKNILVDVINWGEETLSGELLTQFRADMQEIAANVHIQIESGDLVVEELTGTINTAQGITTSIPIGFLFTWSNQRISNEIYEYWQTQFSADPNVEYQPEILQG
jgi:hypothetical protein